MEPTSPDESTSRRPLKTRQWAFFQRTAAALADASVSPNAISLASIAFGVGAGIALAATAFVSEPFSQRMLWIAAAVFIQLRLIANLLDGMVAVEGGRKSATGELFNEIPDRIADPAILVGAGYALGGHPLLGFVAALLALFVAYVRAIGASVGAGQQFLGPMAKPHRMAVLTVACLVCGLTPSSWLPMHESTGLGVAGLALTIIIVGCVVTACRRTIRIASVMKQQAQ